MTQPFGFGNENELGDLNNLTSGEESDEENREDEIKQLLAEAFSNETFDDGSEHSFSLSEHSKIKDRTSNDTSMHSYNGNSDHSNIGKNENSGFSFLNNGHTTVLPSVPNLNQRPHQFTNGRTVANPVERAPQQAMAVIPNQLDNGGGNGNPNEIEENNKTVSLIHKTHCPQLTNGGGCGDTNGNDDNWTSTPINKMEQLQTLNGYRERQIARSEETIASLTKDKRALNHQIGLMRTEMIQMQSSYTDLEKALKLKDEEVEFLKSKIQEAIVDYEGLKREETDVKDENNRLVSQIGRLEQEVKLLSTIGSSTQQAEVDTIVRQIRDRHAQEIISFKTEVANLEAELRSYKRHYNEQKESESISTQTAEPEASEKYEHADATPTRTNCTQTIYSGDEMVLLKDSPAQTETAAIQSIPACSQSSTQTVSNCAQNSTQTEQAPETAERTSASINTSTTTEVQTDETLQTYEVLNSLFEKWAGEVSEATKRAELAESQVQFTEVSLRKLRKKFKALYNMTSVCRKEWKKQEEFLKKQNEEAKSRYLNVLINLHQKFEGLSLG